MHSGKCFQINADGACIFGCRECRDCQGKSVEIVSFAYRRTFPLKVIGQPDQCRCDAPHATGQDVGTRSISELMSASKATRVVAFQYPLKRTTRTSKASEWFDELLGSGIKRILGSKYHCVRRKYQLLYHVKWTGYLITNNAAARILADDVSSDGSQ